MKESTGKKCYTLIGGRRLEFGRDVPEQNVRNDVPLEIQPGTQEEYERAEEFALLQGLFSREHARLEIHPDGVHFADCRQSGIKDATILDGVALDKGGEALMFSHDGKSMSSRNVLFSKMLSMKFTPYYDFVSTKAHEEHLPEKFPLELLHRLYSLKSSTGISSICISPDQYLKQKDHAVALLKVLQRMPQIAESEWWKQWFKRTDNVDPRFGVHEYWLIPQFVTLGRDSRSAIKLENRQWSDVRLRIMFIGNSLYVENISSDTGVEFGVGEVSHPLPPFRPEPLCSGAFVRKDDVMLRFS